MQESIKDIEVLETYANGMIEKLEALVKSMQELSTLLSSVKEG